MNKGYAISIALLMGVVGGMNANFQHSHEGCFGPEAPESGHLFNDTDMAFNDYTVNLLSRGTEKGATAKKNVPSSKVKTALLPGDQVH